MSEVYNKYLHNHAEWSDVELKAKAEILGESLRDSYLTGERREQVQRQMGLVSFEQWCRRNIDVADGNI